jgi:hypothetical protein
MSSDSPLSRFRKSMEIDYEKWHDGVGYDLDALREARGTERKIIESILVARERLDWRDIEALAALDTQLAHEKIEKASRDPSLTVRLAVINYAPHSVSDEYRERTLVEALRTADLYEGLSQALDQVALFHPPRVVRELLRGTLSRSGDVAALFAAMLLYVHGKSDDPFDMRQRPFFLRFNTESSPERRKAFIELCGRIGVSPGEYLSDTR